MPPGNLSAVWQLLDRQAKAVASMMTLSGQEDDDLLWWTHSYELQLRDHMSDLILWHRGSCCHVDFAHHSRRNSSAESTDWLERSELQAELLRLDGIPLLREVPEVAEKMALIDQISSYFALTAKRNESGCKSLVRKQLERKNVQTRGSPP